MNAIDTIPLTNLVFILIPVFSVFIILIKWRLKTGNAFYAMCRMLAQLLLIGYFLNTLFASDSASITLLILTVMLLFSSWIALNSVKKYRRKWFAITIVSLFLSCGFILAIIIFAVLELTPWYEARYIIPLGGMILANTMNSISLSAERFQSEIKDHPYEKARNIAFNAALIPTVNMLFAVGIVSLPGMMTGQILSGIPPFVAARYQIMVMCMVFASSGISVACFLTLIRDNKHNA